MSVLKDLTLDELIQIIDVVVAKRVKIVLKEHLDNRKKLSNNNNSVNSRVPSNVQNSLQNKLLKNNKPLQNQSLNRLKEQTQVNFDQLQTTPIFSKDPMLNDIFVNKYEEMKSQNDLPTEKPIKKIKPQVLRNDDFDDDDLDSDIVPGSGLDIEALGIDLGRANTALKIFENASKKTSGQGGPLI